MAERNTQTVTGIVNRVKEFDDGGRILDLKSTRTGEIKAIRFSKFKTIEQLPTPRIGQMISCEVQPYGTKGDLYLQSYTVQGAGTPSNGASQQPPANESHGELHVSLRDSNRDRLISRQVALKAAVKTCPPGDDANKVLDMADLFLAWILEDPDAAIIPARAPPAAPEPLDDYVPGADPDEIDF